MSIQQSYVTEVAALFPPQGEWAEADYFALPDTTRIVELSEGEITVSPPPSPRHQEAVGNLYLMLRSYVADRDVGRVFFAPIAVRLWEGKIREPDVLFVRAEHAGRVGDTFIDGPPDWAAEVISPGSRRVDEVEKVAEYAQAGVPEYWLVDPAAYTIRVFVLQGDVFDLASVYRAGEDAISPTLSGFHAPVDVIIPSGED
jgi:Uma2 family endonuclease